MANVTVKNIPDDLYARLKVAAAKNRRSINSEIIVCIEEHLMYRRVPAEQVLDRVRQIRSAMRPTEMTIEQIDNSRREGRA
jgi:plasmid stability protein